MVDRQGRPPMVKNYAQNQTFEGSGNAFGVLARPGDKHVEEDADIPSNGIEHLRNNRVRIYWIPTDWQDADRIGEIKETVLDENNWVRFHDPDYCPRPVIHMYPDFVTEQPNAIMKPQDPGQEAGLGVYHQYLFYDKARSQEYISEHVKKSPERMAQFVDEISNEWDENALRKLKNRIDALDLDLKSSSSSSSSSSDSS